MPCRANCARPSNHGPVPNARLFWIHGSGYTQDSFRAQVEAFPKSEALSLPGHPEGEPLTSVADMARWLARHVRESGNGKAVVGGNSLGGAIVLEWALQHPEQAAGLILIGTGARLRVSPAIFESIDNSWPACIEQLVDFAVSSNASAELRQHAREWHERVGQRATRLDYAACDEFDVMERLGQICVPTLIVVGSEDKLTPAKFSRFLHERIQGSELLEVPGAGHIVMAERPDVVNPAIGTFLEKITAAPA